MRGSVLTVTATFLVHGTLSTLPQDARSNDAALKIVAFGTSLTARGGWTQPLETALGQCLGRPVTVAVVAKSGATSDWGVSAVDRVIAESPDIVLIEFSVNDAALHRLVSLRRSRENLARMIDMREQLAGLRIIVMAMNPMSGIRGAIRPFLDRYIDAHREVAEAKGAEFVDHRPAWRALSAPTLSAAIPDGIHPLQTIAAAIIVPRLVTQIADGRCAMRSVPPNAQAERPFR